MSTAQIKAKLSECYKKRKPVLLHGSNSPDIYDLVLEVHKANGGIESACEYVGDKKEPDSKIFIEKITDHLVKALSDEFNKTGLKSENKTLLLEIADILQILARWSMDENNKILKEIKDKVQKYFKSTAKTWKYVNCESMPGEGVYYELVHKGILDNIKIGDLFSIQIEESYLFDYKGTLFIDNLHCDPVNDKDIEYYCKLGDEIEKNKVSVNWFIVYTHDPEAFPKDFVNQFEPIPLDGEGTVVVEDKQKKGKFIQPKTEKTIKLKLVTEGSMVYWGNNLLPTIKGKDFDILLKLAEKRGMTVVHNDLYQFIDSDTHADELLRQRITKIRNAFPYPYSNIKHPPVIIKTARMEGYYLNLTEEQVEITLRML